MPEPVKVAFASGTDDLNRKLVARMREIFPELPLWVVSEFPPEDDGVRWIPYHVARGFGENRARCRAALAGKKVRLAGVVLVPDVPYRRMRLMALLLSPAGFLAFNENLNDFMLRPRCAGAIARHVWWRARNWVRWQVRPGGWAYTVAWRAVRPREWRVPLAYWLGMAAGWLRGSGGRSTQEAQRHGDFSGDPAGPGYCDAGGPGSTAETQRRGGESKSKPEREEGAEIRGAGASEIARVGADAGEGISIVIPSRNGRELLAAQLPGIVEELAGLRSEIIVSDNGSDDGTADWLAGAYPGVVCLVSEKPLSFARAVNRGIRRARYSHVLLLNNDMILERGFFPPLIDAFTADPDLFCATAQIRFPAGVRREETGKAMMVQPAPEDFPVRCEEPLPGEDGTYVLYGSGGCSLYDTVRLRELGGVSEQYDPAYVEDLDLGWRGWQRGWPTVYAARAAVEHRHRTTTSKYFSPEELDRMLEVHYLRFLAGTVSDREVFRKLWRQAIRRLLLRARAGERAAEEALEQAAGIARRGRPPAAPVESEALLAALASGDVAAFPGRAAGGRPRVLVASPYVPYPLSHGGAVRMYNLMRRAAAEYDQVLVAFADRLEPPAAELLEICTEVTVVRRRGSHSLPSTGRPETVEEFASQSFRAALRQAVRKWRPAVAQLEFTQMAQYAADCGPARTALVEHDVTFDLYEQLLAIEEDWEARRELGKWRRFETAAWERVDQVVVMSERDRRTVGDRAVCLPNGVDLERFRPGASAPEAGRLLFIGSFAHFPNVLALQFFLDEVWPRLEGARLHVIAGARHEYFLARSQERAPLRLDRAGVEVEGFVADVRPAYERAAVVIAPLQASAGTNIKILEAMAMGKAIVSTPAGVNGLDLTPGEDFVPARTGEEMAREIARLLGDEAARRQLERAARLRAEREFSWDSIARRQSALYRDLAR